MRTQTDAARLTPQATEASQNKPIVASEARVAYSPDAESELLERLPLPPWLFSLASFFSSVASASRLRFGGAPMAADGHRPLLAAGLRASPSALFLLLAAAAWSRKNACTSSSSTSQSTVGPAAASALAVTTEDLARVMAVFEGVCAVAETESGSSSSRAAVFWAPAVDEATSVSAQQLLCIRFTISLVRYQVCVDIAILGMHVCVEGS